MPTSTKALRVREVMLPPSRLPAIGERALFKEALEVMQRDRLGIACITRKDGALLGIVTAGDVCRALLKQQKPLAALFADDALLHATRSPRVSEPEMALVDAVRLMEKHQIWDLPVVEENRLKGLLHLHPAVKALLSL